MAPIPPSEAPAHPPGWVSTVQLELPDPRLVSSEADGFLEYLFSALARRPRPLALREGARVARYLKALAWETGPRRRLLERLAELIWGMVLQFAPFEPGGKLEVVRFLERHAGTYLAGCDLEAALKHVRDSATPMHYGALFQLPHLMSRSRSAQGRGNPHLREDLSERIYVGYHALRRAGVRNVRARIAEALNRQGLRKEEHRTQCAIQRSQGLHRRAGVHSGDTSPRQRASWPGSEPTSDGPTPALVCTLTLEEWESLREMYDACVYCGRPFSEEHPALVGNAIPLSRRGDHAFENVYPSCRTCLYRKKDKTMDEYFEYLDRKGTAPTRV